MPLLNTFIAAMDILSATGYAISQRKKKTFLKSQPPHVIQIMTVNTNNLIDKSIV